MLGERGRASERIEGAADVALAGSICEPVRHKACDGNKGEQDDTGANRERREHPRQPIERKQKLGELHAAWIWSRQLECGAAQR